MIFSVVWIHTAYPKPWQNSQYSHIATRVTTSIKGVRVGIARAGNVIGGGDWAKDRIVPDFMRAWSNKHSMEIRSPNSTRPWQHVLEPLSGYLTLARCLVADEALHKEAFNFGPFSDQNCTVEELTSCLAVELGNPHWEVGNQRRL